MECGAFRTVALNICGLYVAFTLSRAGPKCNTPIYMVLKIFLYVYCLLEYVNILK